MSFYEPPSLSTDYIATYDPSTSRIERLELPEFDSARKFGVSVHGMDVVSSLNTKDIFIYLVNHRPPLGDPSKLGANSVIEIFMLKPGRERQISHVQTVEHPLILSPNDVVGSSDGKSFYFTNDNAVKIGHFVSDHFGIDIGSDGLEEKAGLHPFPCEGQQHRLLSR